ncbi:MAG: chloride channel protein, partial [Candidatus Altiarchaeota archaeon]|nr:chloride channel protein [Candidatus Altiarchaeota archaeon]
CGISAGFAAIFGTPIAGAIFGVEVLVVGGLLYDVLLPSFIAGIVSYHTASALGVLYLKHNIGFVPVFSSTFFIEVIVSGIFFGLCSLILIEALNYGRNLSRRLALWQPLKGFLGGVILIFLTLIFSTRYLGLGTDIIEDALNGRGVLWYDFLLKTVYTSITLNFGGSGGIITPTFYLGATSGALFADVFNLDIATFASIGFVSLLAGAANTPIAASIMATELFGPEIAPYAAIACIVSFLISGHRSVYPSQFLAMKKSASIDVEIGGEIEDARPKTRVRSKKLKKAINAARNVGKKDI